MTILLHNGVVADNPVSLTDKIRVSVPDLYQMPRQVYGPMPFRPVVSGHGGTRLPEAGDSAVVGVDDENGDSWVISWHRDDPTAPPYSEVAAGGSNLIPNPSFKDGINGYSVAAGVATLAPTSAIGLFGDESAVLTKITADGDMQVISPRATVLASQLYSASAYLRRATSVGSISRIVSIYINWYDAIGTFISSSLAGTINNSAQTIWDRPVLSGVTAPDAAAEAEIALTIAAVTNGDSYFLDGFQLEPGALASLFSSNFAASTLDATMLAPGTITDRELSADLRDELVTDVIAGMPAQAYSGLWDFPYTLDPRLTSGNRALTPNNFYYFRVQGHGTISKLAFNLGTGDGAGTAYGGVYTNVGSGRAARPAARRASGSVSTSGNGYKEVPLGASLTVNHGEWFAFGTNSATATFGSSVPNPGGVNVNALSDGLAHFQAAILPTIPDPVGALSNYITTIILVGVV